MSESAMNIKAIIDAHTNSVISGNIDMPKGICIKCQGKPDSFKLHECRKRSFRFIAECFVYIVMSFLVRWKCPICKATFTDYPPFALPFKRYVVSDIEQLCSSYLDDPSATYRKCVSHEKSAIAYHSDHNAIDERQLSHSSLWRWVTFFGNMHERLASSLDLIHQKCPDPVFTRSLFMNPISRHKFHSQVRKIILQTAQNFLISQTLFETIFGTYCFPRFGTANGWI